MLTPAKHDVINVLREIVKIVLPLRDQYTSLYDEAYGPSGVTASLDASPSGGRSTYSDPTARAALDGHKAHQRNCMSTAADDIGEAVIHLQEAMEALVEGWREQLPEFDKVCYHCGNEEPRGLLKGLCHKDYHYQRGNREHRLPSWEVLNKRDQA